MAKGIDGKRVPKFTNWLAAHGAEMLPLTNEFELIRFKHPGGVGVVYSNLAKNKFSVSDPEVLEIYNKYLTAANWTGNPDKRKRRKRAPKAIEQLIAAYGTHCFYCGRDLPHDEMTEEHLLSLVHGGSNRIENKAIACDPCNKRASHLPLVEKVRLRDRIRAQATVPKASPIQCPDEWNNL